MREYIRYAKRMQLKKLAGKVTMRENWPNWRSWNWIPNMADLVLIDTVILCTSSGK